MAGLVSYSLGSVLAGMHFVDKGLSQRVRRCLVAPAQWVMFESWNILVSRLVGANLGRFVVWRSACIMRVRLAPVPCALHRLNSLYAGSAYSSRADGLLKAVRCGCKHYGLNCVEVQLMLPSSRSSPRYASAAIAQSCQVDGSLLSHQQYSEQQQEHGHEHKWCGHCEGC